MSHWVKVETLRYNLMEEGVIVGCVFPGDGCIRAWSWPLGASERVFLPDAISVGRAQQEVEDAALSKNK